MTPLCHEKIILSPLSETYCMRARGHVGKCSPQLDTPPQKVPPTKVTSTPVVTPLMKAGD